MSAESLGDWALWLAVTAPIAAAAGFPSRFSAVAEKIKRSGRLGEVALDAMAVGDPQMIGRYRLEARLGRGGMGEVFLGRSPGGRAVAVKVVRPELAADAQFRQRFAAEVEAARKVGGFHTTPVVDADPHGDPPWLVTAYIPGPSLAEVITTHGALPERSLRVLAAGLAEALEAIHTAGLVHRDLKPSNILLASDGPRVIDFGIARALDATALTQAGASVGTPGFMAPEQITGATAVGPAADVFAFGSVLCHASGIQPFGEGPTTALLYRVVHQEPDLTGLPDGLLDLVARCLAKDPAERPTPAQLLEPLSFTDPATAWLPQPVQGMLTEHSVPQPRQAPPPPPAPQAPTRQAPPDLRPDGVSLRGVKWPLAVNLAVHSVRQLLGIVALSSSLILFRQPDDSSDGAEVAAVVLLALALLMIVPSIRTMFVRIIALVRPYAVHIGPGGIDLHHSGTHTFYRWSDIHRVSVRRAAQRHAWAVSVFPVPGLPLPPTGDARSTLPYLEKKTGWIVVAPTRELSTSRREIEAAIARFAGPRWGGNA